MNVASLARAARQSLARGLEALQARDAPPALIDVAQTVAHAIGALVDLELSPGTPSAESVEAVLDALRDGLRLLQHPEYSDHPAAAHGMKSVAEAIGIVLTLARSVRQRAPSVLERPPPAPAPVRLEHTPIAASSMWLEAAPTPPEPPPAPAPLRPEPAPALRDARTAMPSRAPVAIRRDVVIERDLRAVDAPLGAHSPSNFYSGLAGGDVVASGGLFVATYRVPKVGEKVLLKISMPGGFEFVAKAQVAWTRDVALSLSPGSPRELVGAPGFGARFCEITDEGRRLIQRYVRNREPLFYEDGS